MQGDTWIRHSTSCKPNVYNVRKMTAAQVEDLVLRTSGQLCIHLYTRWKDMVLTRDCPVGLSWAQVRMEATIMTTATFALVLLTPLLLRLGSN